MKNQKPNIDNSHWDAGRLTCRENYAHQVKIMLKYVKIRDP